MLNSRYFSSYISRFGFSFSIDRLHGLTMKLPHVVMTSIAPPASLYGALPRMTPDVTVFSDFNFETHWSSLLFNEPFIKYTGLPLNIKLGFVIDVKAF